MAGIKPTDFNSITPTGTTEVYTQTGGENGKFTLEDLKEYLKNSPVFSYINYFDYDSLSTTTITGTTEFVKLNTNTESTFSNDGLIHTNNRITNNSNESKVLKVEGIISLSSGNNNQIHIALFKNDEIVLRSEQDTVADSGGKLGALPFHCIVQLDVNDYIEVWVKNSTAATNININNINVICTQLQ